MMHPYNGILRRNRNKLLIYTTTWWTSSAFYFVREVHLQRLYIVWFYYMTFWLRSSYKDGKQTSVCWGLGDDGKGSTINRNYEGIWEVRMELVSKESWQSIRCFICQRLWKDRVNLLSVNYILKINKQDFPGGPGAKTPCCQFGGPKFNSLSKNQIPHAIDTSFIPG